MTAPTDAPRQFCCDDVVQDFVCEHDGRPMWVGTYVGDWRPVALDEKGHLVRGKRTAAAAVEAYLALRTST